jgi:hypothetical protein
LIRRQLGDNFGDFFDFHGAQYSTGGAWFSDGKGLIATHSRQCHRLAHLTAQSTPAEDLGLRNPCR